MKNLQKKLIAAVAIVVFALIGGYFAAVNIQESGEAAQAVEQKNPIQVEVAIDYVGEADKTAETKSTLVEEGDTAWDALRTTVGIENICFKDYGGDLGIFISGINKVKPSGNKFWLFKVNGESSNVGVSAYKVKPGDKLEFVIAEAK